MDSEIPKSKLPELGVREIGGSVIRIIRGEQSSDAPVSHPKLTPHQKAEIDAKHHLREQQCADAQLDGNGTAQIAGQKDCAEGA